MKYVYLISNFIPVLIALAILWYIACPLLKRSVPILIILSLIGLMNGLAEGFALQWGIWYYNNTNTLGVTIFNVYLETYIYCLLIPICIGSATLIFAQWEDSKHAKHK